AVAGREPRRTHCLETVLGPCSVLENRLNLDGELDLVAHQHASGLQRLVPGEAEVPAVDAAAGAEADALATPRVLPASLVDHVEGHLASHVLDREIAHQLELIARGCERPAYGTAPEADGRILLDLQEVGRAEVVVPILHPGINAGRTDLDLYPRVVRVPFVCVNRARHVAETTF